MKLMNGKYVSDYKDDDGVIHNMIIPVHINPIAVNRLATLMDKCYEAYDISRGDINDNTK